MQIAVLGQIAKCCTLMRTLLRLSLNVVWKFGANGDAEKGTIFYRQWRKLILHMKAAQQYKSALSMNDAFEVRSF